MKKRKKGVKTKEGSGYICQDDEKRKKQNRKKKKASKNKGTIKNKEDEAEKKRE